MNKNSNKSEKNSPTLDTNRFYTFGIPFKWSWNPPLCTLWSVIPFLTKTLPSWISGFLFLKIRHCVHFKSTKPIYQKKFKKFNNTTAKKQKQKHDFVIVYMFYFQLDILIIWYVLNGSLLTGWLHESAFFWTCFIIIFLKVLVNPWNKKLRKRYKILKKDNYWVSI